MGLVCIPPELEQRALSFSFDDQSLAELEFTLSQLGQEGWGVDLSGTLPVWGQDGSVALQAGVNPAKHYVILRHTERRRRFHIIMLERGATVEDDVEAMNRVTSEQNDRSYLLSAIFHEPGTGVQAGRMLLLFSRAFGKIFTDVDALDVQKT